MLSDPNFSSPANLDASVRPTAEPSAQGAILPVSPSAAQVQMRQDPDAYKAKVAVEVAETKKPENLPPGFKLPNAGGAAAAEDFSYGSDEDGSDDDDDDAMDDGGGAVDASGLSAAENRIVGQVCEMGFDRAAVVRPPSPSKHPLQTPGRDLITDAASQIGVVEKLKERGKEISNDSVAEKMLDL